MLSGLTSSFGSRFHCPCSGGLQKTTRHFAGADAFAILHVCLLSQALESCQGGLRQCVAARLDSTDGPTGWLRFEPGGGSRCLVLLALRQRKERPWICECGTSA